MDYDFIQLEKDNGVATLTLNRPEKMNALSAALLREFSDALDDVDNDQDVNVLLLTGAGRAFSAGFDISPGQAHEGVAPTAQWDATNLGPRTIMKLWDLRQPTICAVNGHALAAGNVLAMTADIVIAADNAVFGEPEIRFVAHSPAIMLPYMIPFRHLNWLYFTGDTVDAQTAERWNMVNKVVPADSLMDEAMKAARRIAGVPPYAAQMMKRSIRGAYEGMGFTDAFENHLKIRMVEGMADDVPEKEALRAIREEQGMRAFLQARDAAFQDDSPLSR